MTTRTLLVIAESLSGNTNSFVERVQEEYSGWHIHVATPYEIDYPILCQGWDKIMIGCYTWSNGKIPRETKAMVIEFRNFFLGEEVLIFGSGWSIYQNYCGAVDGISTILDNKFPTVKFELMYDAEVEVEAEETLKQYMEANEYDYLSRETTGHENSYSL